MNEVWVSVLLATIAVATVAVTLWGVAIIADLLLRRRPRDNEWRLAEQLAEKVSRWPARW